MPTMVTTARRWMSKEALFMGLLIVGGFAYFSGYYDAGFDFRDEGVALLISKRLLEGELPFVDVFVGYGVLWFSPLVLLFKFTGVSFIVARVYFLSLALITSLLAFQTVRGQTGRTGVAAAAALLILTMPGSLHKIYIPLIIVANMLCLTWLDLDRPTLERGRLFTAALVAAISYHIRPDLGLAALAILLATFAVHAWSTSPEWRTAVGRLVQPVTVLGAAILTTTLPLILFAQSKGFLGPFLESLLKPLMFGDAFMNMIQTGTFVEATPGIPAQAGTTLARAPLTSIWHGGSSRILAVLTYLPVLTFVVIASIGFSGMIRRRLKGLSTASNDTLGLLALLGLAYSTFPQFFVFRPDVAHLSQFMPGYWVVVGTCLGLCLGSRLTRPGEVSTPRWKRFAAAGMSGVLVFHVGLYAYVGLQHPGAGSIALSRGATEKYLGANGIDVAVTPGAKALFETVARVIDDNTDEDDLVLCFPYAPGFNVMTNRRTFARRLYVDDAMLVMEPGWQQRMVERIQEERPRLIIIHHWAVNGTEISRFPNWATEVMAYIKANYALLESFGEFDFFLLEDENGSR